MSLKVCSSYTDDHTMTKEEYDALPKRKKRVMSRKEKEERGTNK